MSQTQQFAFPNPPSINTPPTGSQTNNDAAGRPNANSTALGMNGPLNTNNNAPAPFPMGNTTPLSYHPYSYFNPMLPPTAYINPMPQFQNWMQWMNMMASNAPTTQQQEMPVGGRNPNERSSFPSFTNTAHTSAFDNTYQRESRTGQLLKPWEVPKAYIFLMMSYSG